MSAVALSAGVVPSSPSRRLTAAESLPRGRSVVVPVPSRNRHDSTVRSASRSVTPRGWFRPVTSAPEVFVTDASRHRPDVVPPLMCGQRSARTPVTSTTHHHRTATTPSPSRPPPTQRHRTDPVPNRNGRRARSAAREERPSTGARGTRAPVRDRQHHVHPHPTDPAPCHADAPPPPRHRHAALTLRPHAAPASPPVSTPPAQRLATEERGSDPKTPSPVQTRSVPASVTTRPAALSATAAETTHRPHAATRPDPAPQTLTAQPAEGRPQGGPRPAGERERGTSEHRQRTDARPVDVPEHTRGAQRARDKPPSRTHHATAPDHARWERSGQRDKQTPRRRFRTRTGNAGDAPADPDRVRPADPSRQPVRERRARSPVTKSRADVSLSRVITPKSCPGCPRRSADEVSLLTFDVSKLRLLFPS